MNEADTRMMVRGVLNTVFLPQLMVTMGAFLLTYTKRAIESQAFFEAFGFVASIGDPLILDTKEPMRQLEEALVIALKDPDSK